MSTLVHADGALRELMSSWPRLTEALSPGAGRRWVERQQEVDDDGRRIPQATGVRCPDCRSLRLRTSDVVVTSPEPATGQPVPTGQVLPGKLYCPRGCDDQPLRPGYTRSPVSDDALSVLVSVGTDLVWLEDNVREQLDLAPLDERDPVREAHRHRHGQPRLAGRDPLTAAKWLLKALPALTEHADLARHVEQECRRLARTVRYALGDVEDVHPIKAPCPVCSCMSLRAFPERELIVCVNDRCSCTDPSCRCDAVDHPRRHRWPRDQWDWLAQVLGVELEHADGSA